MKQLIKSEHIIRDQLLQIMIDNEGTDMYLTVGTYPSIKIGGDILRVDD
jgi:Tfp pilus assembly ATPase PilU